MRSGTNSTISETKTSYSGQVIASVAVRVPLAALCRRLSQRLGHSG